MLTNLPRSWRERAGIVGLVVTVAVTFGLPVARAMRPHPPA